MTDDSNPRYRPSDPFGRDPAPNNLASDPLAELARLIGQTDPFAELKGRGREQGEPRAVSRDAGHHEDPPPRYDDLPIDLPPWPPATTPRDYDEYDAVPREEPFFARRQDRREYDEPQGRLEPSFDPLEPAAYDAGPPQRPRDLPGFELPDLPGFSRPDAPAEPPPDPLGLAAQEPQLFATRDDLPRYIANDLAAYAPQVASELHTEDVPQPHDDEFPDEAPRGRGRKGMVTVLAVLGLAVIGTAGAFGYRTLVSGPKSTAPPPVIRASTEPSKVAPPPASNEPANKLSYDRFGDRSQNERVVVREEKPIDTRELSRSSGPRVILPGAPIPSDTRNPRSTGVADSTGSASLGVMATSPRSVPSAIGEPRRVRTLQIRPDQPDAAASPNQMAALPSLPQQVQTPAVPHDNALPEAARQPPPEAVSPPPVRARATALRSTSPRPAAPPPSGANAPLSLAPDSAELPPPGSAAVRTSPAAQPTRIASAPSGGGGYLVQVSSQRSEADAQAAYRSLRAKYSNVLGDRQHVIRRADLGSRGVFYRAMVGPFGSREEAIQVCGNLKAAGGDCVVQSN